MTRVTFRTHRGSLLAVSAGLLLLLVLLSLAVGTHPIPLGRVLEVLRHDDGSNDAEIVRGLRFSRTMLGVGAGIALGLAGALMQALTRNPLADPGILGVNAGAAVALVLAAGVLGFTTPEQYVWFAFAGAFVASLIVYGIAAPGRSRADPARLALAGTALTAVLSAVVTGLILLRPETFDRFRFWQVGALAGHSTSTALTLMPFLVVGAVLALLLARSLNAIALGDEAGRAVGARVGRIRAAGALAVVLLCGAATAAVGPIGFVGLAVPQAVRLLTGPDYRWLLAYCVVVAPALLLAADIIGRVVVRPGELPVGVVTAFIGAPVFILLVRRRRLVQL